MQPTMFDPAVLEKYTYPTPFLLIDPDAIMDKYRSFTTLLPRVQLHYAMKCNPDTRILTLLHNAGSQFEIASLAELESLLAIGVEPTSVLFTNPVKMWQHIQGAYQAGVRRFSFDSNMELEKIATYAPGAEVFVRLKTVAAASGVPSEGKFGVDTTQAAALMRQARSLGLGTYGISFHVGSQMTDPQAWEQAIAASAELMKILDKDHIRIKLLDMGGGFPAQYTEALPPLSAFASCINQALSSHLPYEVQLAIEPGRALVAEAGVMVATVIGLASRGKKDWLHIDVGAFNGLMEALESQNQLRFPVSDSKQSPRKALYHLTGPSCDSQDTILYDVALSAGLKAGDRVYIHTSGAYTTAYASTFNGFAVPTVYFI
ncbi:MAG TPA: type III PLP-dependent enzyme [Candidatus Acidoferrum sp.]|nr:type III PLP-dependent enzyme [Candidatus Acidoferrum sp.]